MLMKQSEEKKVKQVQRRNNALLCILEVEFITNVILYLNRKEVRL